MLRWLPRSTAYTFQPMVFRRNKSVLSLNCSEFPLTRWKKHCGPNERARTSSSSALSLIHPERQRLDWSLCGRFVPESGFLFSPSVVSRRGMSRKLSLQAPQELRLYGCFNVRLYDQTFVPGEMARYYADLS